MLEEKKAFHQQKNLNDLAADYHQNNWEPDPDILKKGLFFNDIALENEQQEIWDKLKFYEAETVKGIHKQEIAEGLSGFLQEQNKKAIKKKSWKYLLYKYSSDKVRFLLMFGIMALLLLLKLIFG